VGQLEEDAIFYLRSRGIDHETAKKLLTYAFASELIDQIKVEPLREQIVNILSADLPIQDKELALT
jgi:Fe-S cluster assembly protein SufD